MKNKFILSCLFLFVSVMAFAEENSMWYRFEDNKTNLIGFKDTNGSVKIEPKFITFITADKFDKIIAVMEKAGDDKYKNYYLTKTGKKVGIDSLYIHDNTPDCESEGFIRFKDRKIGKIGLFDGNGNVVVPPVYDSISRVHNGMMFALQGALKRKEGEYAIFIGGLVTLIDVQNNTLIESFPRDNNINLYSIVIEDANHSLSPIRDYFKGKNGKTYSFINYEKEFKYWFELILAKEIESGKIENHFFAKISHWDDTKWELVQKKYLRPELIRNIVTKLDTVKNKNVKYNIFLQDLNKFIFESEEFKPFFDNCGESITAKYPLMNIVVDGTKNEKYVQDHFEFLRTDDGYKLVGVSINSK